MRSNTINKHTRSINLRLSAAFTIIELIVVISIIGILAAITVVSYGSWKQSTITTQLKSDLNGVVGAMENARTFNDSGYPADVNSLTTFTKSSGVTLSGGSSDGGKTYCVSAVNSQFSSLPYHVDSSNTVVQSGACTASVQFNLITIAGTGGTVSTGGSYTFGSTQTITATPNTNYSFSSWTGDTGCSGVASHTITMDTNKTCTANFTASYNLTLVAGTGGAVSGSGSYASGATPTITATPNAYYSFSSWTGTNCSGAASHVVPAMTADMTCTANFTPTTIAAPATPTVTPSTAGATTTFSWGTASCPGNTARYQYRYTISSGYNSGLVATSATSVAFTTSTEGQTYTVAVQAECYNAVTASGMSGAGTGSYYRPVPAIWGCTDPGAANYDPSANASRGCVSWLPGLASTVLAGKYVGSADLYSMYQYKTTNDDVTSPQGVTGLDPNYPSNKSLVNPQTNPGVDFSAYPAQDACKAIGGRLPNMQESYAIYVGKVSYGNNFTEYYRSDYNWSSTEYNSGNAYIMYYGDGSARTDGIKANWTGVRCVKG